MMMSGERMARTLGWAAVATGVVICTVALFSLPEVVEHGARQVSESDESPDLDTWFGAMDLVLERFGLIRMLVYLGFGGFVAWAGSGMIRGSGWAVRALQVACWVALVQLVVHGALQILIMRSFLAPASGRVSNSWLLPLIMAGSHLRLVVIIGVVSVLVLLRRCILEGRSRGEA